MKNFLPATILLLLCAPNLGAQTDSVITPPAGLNSAFNPAPLGAVAHLKSPRFNQGNLVEPIQLVQGKIAGLSIARPGGDPNGRFITRIRGLSSRISNTEPLIVLNGVPGASLQLIDPADITSFTVLKDASSTAIYGMRGAAGVILVETDHGQSDRFGVTYSAQLAFDKATGRYDVLDAGAFLQAGGEDLSPGANAQTDWQEEIIRNGLSQAHHLQFGGKLGNGTVYAGLHYRGVEGVLRDSDLKQYSGNLGFSQSFLKNRVQIKGNLLAARRETGYGTPEAFRYALTFNPTAPTLSSDPQWAAYGGFVQPALFDYFNPLAMIMLNSNRGETTRMLGNLSAGVELFRNFTLTARVAREQQDQLIGEYYNPQSNWRGYNQQGSLRRFQNEQTANLFETTGQYRFNIGANTAVDLLGGYAWQQFEYEAGDTSASGTLGLTRASALSEFEGLQLISSDNIYGAFTKGKNTLAAFFGRARINFQERYFFEAGLRREGSNRLGRNQKWGNFPFVSAGADFSKILSIKAFDQLKLRAGYGISGQQPASDGLSRQVLTPSTPVFYNGDYIVGYGPTTNENPDLKWEEKREFNLGLDIAFADNRLKASIDYFKNTTSDLIAPFTVPVPPNVASTTYLNAQELSGNGLEFSLAWDNILHSEKLDWSANLVYSRYAVRVEKTGLDAPFTLGSPGAPGMCCGQYILIQEGQPVGQIWGPVRVGINAGGSIQYKDIDRDGAVNGSTIDQYNQDQTLIGNALPKFELGFQNNVRWRQFDLNFFLRGVFGHEMIHENRLFYENARTPVFYNNVRTKYFDSRMTGFSRMDDTFVEQASFLRLDNLTLGYNFRLPENAWVRKARLYIGGQNLLTISPYTGLDPEIRLTDIGPTDNGGRYFDFNEPFVPGVDRRQSYFPARTLFFGFVIGF